MKTNEGALQSHHNRRIKQKEATKRNSAVRVDTSMSTKMFHLFYSFCAKNDTVEHTNPFDEWRKKKISWLLSVSYD